SSAANGRVQEKTIIMFLDVLISIPLRLFQIVGVFRRVNVPENNSSIFLLYSFISLVHVFAPQQKSHFANRDRSFRQKSIISYERISTDFAFYKTDIAIPFVKFIIKFTCDLSVVGDN